MNFCPSRKLAAGWTTGTAQHNTIMHAPTTKKYSINRVLVLMFLDTRPC